jgi:hypothetical protein
MKNEKQNEPLRSTGWHGDRFSREQGAAERINALSPSGGAACRFSSLTCKYDIPASLQNVVTGLELIM